MLVVALLPFASRGVAQDAPGQENTEEIVANLCTGRVIIGVAKDGIVVATLENPIEPQTRPPMIVPISDESVAVLLGAADWWLPDEHRELARLYAELPSLPREQGGPNRPHLQGYSEGGAGSEATGVESLADNLRARLASIANHIHGDLKLGDGQPLLQMVVADYAPDYGPEVWLVKYFVEQDPEQGDYWQTRILQPQYDQLWPPEKGQPRGLVEVSYPAAPAVASKIRAGDAHLAQFISSSPGMQGVSSAILDGSIEKLAAVDVAAFLRTCLGAVTVSNARMVEAEINKQHGIGWFIEPPAEKPTVGSEQVRPAGAPSLLHPSKPGGPGQR
ncbi:MAG TPA: hypothetical protein VKB26_15185 [Candidatus Acidoferrales bacterium]|nr:hypothetical protein [Candidatus Acidoferrales bacterium]